MNTVRVVTEVVGDGQRAVGVFTVQDCAEEPAEVVNEGTAVEVPYITTTIMKDSL